MPTKYDEEQKHWTIDRHIPIAVLVVILLQTVGVIVWAVTFRATTEQRLEVLEKQVDRMALVSERIHRVEAISVINTDLLREIRTVLINPGRFNQK